MHSCTPPPTCPFYEAGMPTPLTISFWRLALLPTEATLADGAESVLLQPGTNMTSSSIAALHLPMLACVGLCWMINGMVPPTCTGYAGESGAASTKQPACCSEVQSTSLSSWRSRQRQTSAAYE